MSVISPELMSKVDEVLAFGKATPEANRAAVADALAPLQNYRAEFPFLRLTHNQELSDPDGNGRPDGWVVGSNINCEIVETITTSKLWADRSAIEKEIMTAAGAEGIQHWNYKTCYVWRFSWSLTQDQVDNGVGANYILLQRPIGLTSVTYKAISKLESGEVYESGFLKGITNTASITGKSSVQASRYLSEVPRPLSLQGSILVAFPGAVAGVHPSDRWGYFEARSGGVS